MTVKINRRPGPRTVAAVAFVAAHPGTVKHAVAVAVGPHGSNAFGDRIVLRAIGRALIENRSTDPRRYALYVTPAGRALLTRVAGS